MTNIFLVGPSRLQFAGWYSPMTPETTALDGEVRARLNSINGHNLSNHAQLLLMGDYGWYNQWKPTNVLTPEEKEIAEWHGRPDHHYMAFLDGHAAFLETRRGMWVTEEYVLLPWKELQPLAINIQNP